MIFKFKNFFFIKIYLFILYNKCNNYNSLIILLEVILYILVNK